MKLVDLAEARVVDRVFGNVQVIDRKGGPLPFDLSKLQHAGSGFFADVYKSPKGNQVIKVARLGHDISEAQNDSTVAYISACMNHQHNPFFTKIKSAKIYKIGKKEISHPKGDGGMRAHHHEHPDDTDGRTGYVLVAVMEKLVPLRRVVGDVAEKLLNDLGLTMDEDKNDVQYTLIDHLGEGGFHSDNPHFEEAMSVLDDLLYHGVHGADTHEGNWMIRPGSPPHLVMTDPIA